MADVISIKKYSEISEEERPRWREMNREEKEILLKAVVNEMMTDEILHLSRRERRRLIELISANAWEKIQQERPHLLKEVEPLIDQTDLSSEGVGQK